MADNNTLNITNSLEYECVEPIKKINDQADVNEWVNTEAFRRLMKFIELSNESVINRKISDPCLVSEFVQRIINMLDTMLSWIDEIPPLPTPQRFDMLPEHLHGTIVELVAYFNGGFGNSTRIDYGSGHELSFVAWLCCLSLIGVIKQEDYTAVILKIFTKYLDLVRRLQRVYMLEPAGSHGVWGLDDHQFLSYYWGSAQLKDHPNLKPKSILSEDFVKKGPFHEHSPLLHDISEVQYWAKVNSGLLKMYIADVLKKFPIVQHFLFGSLLPFKAANQGG
ncbi:12700_t:CDS:2 [Rhizophagus irregularis]|nr:12700_t:CDS:2 [Rhizophagus irregularis]